jgi:hypothetical protein
MQTHTPDGVVFGDEQRKNCAGPTFPNARVWLGMRDEKRLQNFETLEGTLATSLCHAFSSPSDRTISTYGMDNLK